MPDKKQTTGRAARGTRANTVSTQNAKASGNGAGNSKANSVTEVDKLKEPKSPMPPQHQAKPGKETELTPRPRYEAPLYKGAGKLNKKVALKF